MDKDFILTRVVTRDIIRDAFAGIRNMFGLRMRTYESLLQRHSKELCEEMRLKYKKIKWYRMQIDNFSKNSAMINVYGVYEDE